MEISANLAPSAGDTASVNAAQPTPAGTLTFEDALKTAISTMGGNFIAAFAADSIQELAEAGEENSGVGGPA